MAQLIVSMRGVSHAYRALPVLHNLDWHFHAGEQWACLGPNGAGKTTLASILSGQLRCSRKAMCGRDRQRDDSDFRTDAQDPGTTVERAILGQQAPGSHFEYWIGRLGIRHLLRRGIRFISTGEMRKTLLLRAISNWRNSSHTAGRQYNRPRSAKVAAASTSPWSAWSRASSR